MIPPSSAGPQVEAKDRHADEVRKDVDLASMEAEKILADQVELDMKLKVIWAVWWCWLSCALCRASPWMVARMGCGHSLTWWLKSVPGISMEFIKHTCEIGVSVC